MVKCMTSSLLCPTFIGVGAARCGTTSLYHWLNEHPSVFMTPVKETNYFSQLQPRFAGPGDDDLLNKPPKRASDGTFLSQHAAIISSWNDYSDLYLDSEGYHCRGEISPSYLYYPQAAHNIWSRLPDCKIFIFLRDPVERAFSNYKVLVFFGRETASFDTALAIEEERIEMGWEHVWALKGLGLYSSQVKRYLDIFPREQVFIALYEDLKSHPAEFYIQTCEFIHAGTEFMPDFLRYNYSSSEIANLQLYSDRHGNAMRVLMKLTPLFMRRLLKPLAKTFLGTRKLVMAHHTRKYLLEYYRKDILELHDLVPELDIMQWIRAQEGKLRNGK